MITNMLQKSGSNKKKLVPGIKHIYVKNKKNITFRAGFNIYRNIHIKLINYKL